MLISILLIDVLLLSLTIIVCSVLKDMPVIPSESYGPWQKDSVRLAMFPSLNYAGLYDAVINIMEIAPAIEQGKHGIKNKT